MDVDLTGEPPHEVARPIMLQRWQTLTYLHWPVPPAAVRRLLPEGLEVDTYDGVAWVGLVPFRLAGIRVPGTPPVPYLGTFPETNVRTYVRGAHGPGVWFHSLDVDRLLPAVVARVGYGLPYLWGTVSITRAGDTVGYRTRRRWPGPRGARSHVRVRVEEERVAPTPLDHFLTARWRLYSVLAGRLVGAPVAHEPWPLQRATPLEVSDELVAAAGYGQPEAEPHVRYSPGVSVRVGRPRIVSR